MKITYAGIISVAAYNGIAFALRALGDSLTPLIFLIFATALNVILDLIFVILFGWGIPGVAIATIISQTVAAILCILYAYKKIPLLRLSVGELKLDKEIFQKCIKLGIPIALQNSFVSISTMALQGIINSYGEVVIAAATIVTRIEQLIFEPGCSVGIAVASFTGQNIGAGQIDRVKKGFYAATKIIIVFSLIMLPLMYFGGERVIMLFTKVEDFEVVKVGVEAIRVTSLFYTLVGMIFISRSFLSGAGDTKTPMVMGISEVICRVVFTSVLAAQFGYYGIWWATGLNWLMTSVLGVLWVISGRWKNKSII
jgi:putative MATE family efflux protein